MREVSVCARVHKRRGAVEASLPSCKCDKCVRTCSRVPPPFTCAYKGRAMLKRQVTSEGGQLAGERWRSVCARGGRVEGLEFRARRCVSVWALHLAFVFNAGGKKRSDQSRCPNATTARRRACIWRFAASSRPVVTFTAKI